MRASTWPRGDEKVHRTEPLQLSDIGQPAVQRWPFSDPWNGASITPQKALDQAYLAWEGFVEAMAGTPAQFLPPPKYTEDPT